MVKQAQLWFDQFSDVNVNVLPPWVASYNVPNTPTKWGVNQTQTYSITVTNRGSQSWPATGPNPVQLAVHFANAGGGYGNSTWYSDQRFALPADLVSGASVTLTVSVTAPSSPTGGLTLEYLVVKQAQFWFEQFSDVNVSVLPPWVASYNVPNTPTNWVVNQTQTYSVTVTNAGSQSWPASGSNPIQVAVHFANRGGGYGKNTWYSDQRFPLPADLAPGASVTMTISVTPPSSPTGGLTLEYLVVKQAQFWLDQFADVSVTLH
jgi:hypothetical protein